MRLLSAIIVSGILLTTQATWAAPRDAPPKQRNPIEWLLSDLSNLFRTAVDAIDKKPTEAIPSPKPNIASISLTGSIDIEDDLFGEGNFEPILSHDVSSKNERGDAEPTETISDFFQGILAFLNQEAPSDKTISQGLDDDFAALEAFEPKNIAEDNQSVSTEIETAKEPTSTSDAQHEIDLFATLNRAAEAYENDDVVPTNKPVLSDFFLSLGEIFKGTSTETPLVEKNIVGPSQTADVQTENRSHKDVIAEAPEVTDEETSHSTDTSSYEAAPWQVFPSMAVFAPETDLFDENNTPIPAPTVNKAQQIDIIEVAEAPIEIRKRTSHNPAARNHLSLGRTKTAEFPDETSGFFDHLIETFSGEDGSSSGQTEVLANKIPDRLVPEEKLDLGYVAPDATVKAAPQDELTTIGEGVLKNIDLYLGTNTVIGHPYQPNAHQSGACIERSLQVSVFCVTDIEWPTEVASSFAQDTAFTLPGEGVVRYENGRVSRVYTPFKASDFAQVVKFMQHRFGPPLEREVVWMHMIEAPKMPNTTFRWRAVSADRRDSVVLEVRNFDDLRRSFADLNRGMVRLYRDGSRPIFKHLSTMDLMLIQRRRVSQAPVTPSDNSAAN